MGEYFPNWYVPTIVHSWNLIVIHFFTLSHRPWLEGDYQVQDWLVKVIGNWAWIRGTGGKQPPTRMFTNQTKNLNFHRQQFGAFWIDQTNSYWSQQKEASSSTLQPTCIMIREITSADHLNNIAKRLHGKEMRKHVYI